VETLHIWKDEIPVVHFCTKKKTKSSVGSKAPVGQQLTHSALLV